MVASNEFAAYFVISAVLRVVRILGHGDLSKIFEKHIPLLLSYRPMTILSGLSASVTAFPSRKNSGFMQRPKSLPITFSEYLSSKGLTVNSVVPGTTVDFTATT